MLDKIRFIPPVHELMKHEMILDVKANNNLSNEFIKRFIQQEIDVLRDRIIKDDISISSREEAADTITNNTIDNIQHYLSPKLLPVINATGTVLHTNLGRARLSESAIDRMNLIARHYSTLEYDVDSGLRGSRHSIVEDYLTALTGAEAALVVNNNAASVYMILKAFAKEKEVIVSRGELVEIGGSFRVSSIMEESGAKLKEVGTTNKTHFSDYQQATNEHTGMLMKVHTSNFKIVGFTSSVEREQLIQLAEDENIVYYEDLGSGMLYDLKNDRIGDEPLVKDVIASGADLVSFSGDKLLGGPQVGIIVGKKKWIDQLKKNQLARVLRVDKISYAALEETLRLTLINSKDAIEQIPTLRDILRSKEDLKSRVKSFIRTNQYENIKLEEINLESKVGGGTMPEVVLDSVGIKVVFNQKSADWVVQQLRKMDPPIITRIEKNQVMMEFRPIHETEEEVVSHHLSILDLEG